MRSRSAAIYFIVGVCPSLPAVSQQIVPQVSVAAEYSDNPYRVNSGARGATIIAGLFGLDVLHQGAFLYADADANVVRLQTVSGDVPNQTLPNGYATLVGNVVPGAFTWSIEDTFGQISNEPFDAITAPNRETVNVLSTGPDLLAPITDRDHYFVQLRYGSATYYNGSNIDSSRYEGLTGLVHDLTGTARVSALVAYHRIMYRNQLYPDAEIPSAFLRYTVERGRTLFIAEGGWEWLRFGTVNGGTPHVLLSLEERISPHVTFTAEYTHTYEDAAGDFVVSSRDAFTAGTDQNVQALASPFKTDTGYATLSRRGRRTRIALELTAERDVYDAAPLYDRRTYGTYLDADYQLSPRLKFTLRGGWYREEYPAESTHTSWVTAEARLGRQLGESLRVEVDLSRIQGSGTFASFKENRAALVITYDPVPSRRERLFNPTTPFRMYEEPNVRGPLPGMRGY